VEGFERMKRSRFTIAAVLVAILLACTTWSRADEILLDDGSRVVGQITSIVDNQVAISTAFAGDLKIDAQRLRGITTAQPMAVTLASGDRVVGTLNYDATAGQRVTGGTLGDVPVALGDVRSVWPAADADAATAAAVSDPEAREVIARTQERVKELEAEVVELEKAQKSLWSVRLQAGLSGQSGNTESIAVRGRVEGKRESANDRLFLFGSGRYSRENSVVSANEIIGGARLEVDITPRLYAFAKVELEYDEIENIDLRALATGGLGYFWIREDDEHLKTSFGVGYQFEAYRNGGNESEAILDIGLDYRKAIAPWILFTHTTQYYPTLDEISEFRLVLNTGFEIPLTTDKKWKLKIGVENRYNSQPPPATKRMDTFYFADLVLDFQ